VRSKHVKNIVCTSTLAEGVNLPAKNLFLVNPYQTTPKYQPNTRLEDVKLKNITGRAGRMLEHFSGNIFLVEDNKWTYQDYFEEPEQPTEKIPTFYKVLNEESKIIISTLQGTAFDDSDKQYTY
jgi:replicative superfamily II helicase